MFLNAVPFIDKTAIEIIRSVNFDFDFHKMYHNFHEINKVSSLLYISKDRIEGLELYNENQDIANVADSPDIQNMINVKIS